MASSETSVLDEPVSSDAGPSSQPTLGVVTTQLGLRSSQSDPTTGAGSRIRNNNVKRAVKLREQYCGFRREFTGTLFLSRFGSGTTTGGWKNPFLTEIFTKICNSH